jgi:hypothetical protein
MGVLTGLLGLTRTELLLLVPLLLLPLVVTRKGVPGTRRLLYLAAACGLVAAVVAPWVIRNTVVFDRPVLTTNGDFFLGTANCPATYAGEELGWFDVFCLPTGTFTDRARNEADRAADARHLGLTFMREHPARLMTVVVPARIGRLWELYRPGQAVRFAVFDGRPETPGRLGVASFYVLAALAIGGGVVLRRSRAAPVWPLLVPLVVATIAAAVVAPTVRIRAPAEPTIVVLAAVGVVALVRAVRARGSEPTAGPEPTRSGALG